jgi:NADH:ubiquinone oxidoreductase subunit 3 (subunit A)
MTLTAFAIAIDLVLVLALVLAFANSGRLLGPKPKHQGDADMPYETGMRPFAPAYDRMTVLYYRFAVLFVIFDVDLAFLMPWALNRGALTFQLMLSVTVFLALLGLMLGYFWSKEQLEC